MTIFAAGLLLSSSGYGETIFENFQGFDETANQEDNDFLESLTEAGIQMRTSNFDAAGGNDYLHFWVVNISEDETPRRGRAGRTVIGDVEEEAPSRPIGVSR